MLYQVSLWTPSPRDQFCELTTRFVCGTIDQADRFAEQKLPIAFESSYSARVNRRAYVTVQPVKRERRTYVPAGKQITLETPVCIVPSVGERGY